LGECVHPTHRKVRDGWGTRASVAEDITLAFVAEDITRALWLKTSRGILWLKTF
jgi:hypothetical protein